jgi:AcrR family transcriptional regulator
MNNPDKKLRGRPRSLQSHQAMLQATLELLGEVGFDAMSIDAIAYRAGVGKTTIYRRYASKEELVVDAIESVREEIVLPDTGNLQEDIEAIVQNAAETTLSPLGRKTVAMLIGSALSNPQFAEIYWTKYLQPRRRSFAIVLERAKARNEISTDLDSDIVFDMMSGIMLYALVFQPTLELWSTYVRRAISLLIDR